MSDAELIVALLSGLTPDQIAAASPADRRQLASLCRRAAEWAEAETAVNDDPSDLQYTRSNRAHSGVLAQLRDGACRE